MGAKITARDVIRKRDKNRVVNTLSYLAGFPLLTLMTYVGSVPFMDGPGFGGTIAYCGVFACLAIWLVVSLIQIIVAIFTKNCAARAVIVILAAVIIMIGGATLFDMVAEKKLDEIRSDFAKDLYGIGEETELRFVKNQSNKDFATFRDDEYVRGKYRLKEGAKLEYRTNAYGVETVKFKIGKEEREREILVDVPIPNYRYQANAYVCWTSPGVKESLASAYNKKARNFCRAYNVGWDGDIKGDVNTDGSEYVLALERPDGSRETWFGEEGKAYKANGLYGDGYIFSAPVALEILKTYYETRAEYAEKGKDADDELDAALDAARTGDEWREYCKTDEYKAAYGEGGIADNYMITEARLNKILSALGKGIVDKEALDGIKIGPLDVSGMLKGVLSDMGLTDDALKSLTLDGAAGLLEGLGIEMGKDDLLALLGGFSNYEASGVKPLMYFIEDAKLREYAYAEYFGATHGANVGSRLIPEKEGGNTGAITMTSGGSGPTEAFDLAACKDLIALNSYVPALFPLFAARRSVYVFAGIIALMLGVFYYTQMKMKFLAIKLEKMSE